MKNKNFTDKEVPLKSINNTTEIELKGKDQPISILATDIGKLIAEKRNEKGLSMRGLAKLAGIDYGMLSRIENGRANLTIKTLEKIAEALHYYPEISLIRNKESAQDSVSILT